MRCYFCKTGETVNRVISRSVRFRGETFELIHVPADVCTTCGERYFTAKTVRLMDEMIKEAYFRKHPDAPRQLPIDDSEPEVLDLGLAA